MGFDLLQSLVGSAVTVLLAAAAVRAGALTGWAGVTAAAFGVLIVATAGYAYLALLVLFVVASVLATRYGFEEKARRSVQEGVHGERGVSNVLAHIVLPAALAVVFFASPGLAAPGTLAVLYTAAIAFGAADTFASEFGVLAGRARSVLTGRPVPPGTNGGVSLVGQAWALVGALTTAVIGLMLFSLFGVPGVRPILLVVGATAAGFLACQVDSVLGETLENRGRLSKGGTNLLAMVSSVAIAGVVLAVGGAL